LSSFAHLALVIDIVFADVCCIVEIINSDDRQIDRFSWWPGVIMIQWIVVMNKH